MYRVWEALLGTIHVYIVYATYVIKEHESIVVNVCVPSPLLLPLWLTFFFRILSVFLSFVVVFVSFCPLAFKTLYSRIQCEHSSQQSVCKCVCLCVVIFFSLVSLIRIFKVDIFANDDVIGRMQSISKRLTHLFR